MKKYKVAIVTVSDKGSKGQREDMSGKIIKEILTNWAEIVHYSIVPDEKDLIKKELITQSDKVDLILTNGGTGLHPRDVTPDATLEVIEREIPGIAEAIRIEGLKKTKHAMLSRAVAGIRGKTLIINLPGSPKAVKESLEVILEALPHAINKIKGDPSDCAQ